MDIMALDDYEGVFYDAIGSDFPDVPFYERLVTRGMNVLELGCGTGRVSYPMACRGARVTGVDLSEPMLERAHARASSLSAYDNYIPPQFIHADISTLRLGEAFDLIVAPFRVIQALETDSAVDGLFEVIRAHLSPSGSAILNAFKPNRPRDELHATWAQPEQLVKEMPWKGGTLQMWDLRERLDTSRDIIYPTLIYRHLDADGHLVREHRQRICMRCWWPDDFTKLITNRRFHILESWGGYAGEPYGEGNELVVRFSA